MTAQFDVEKLIALRPDLVVSWWTNNPSYAGHLKVKEVGLPVVLTADYEENTPLGRTEWIKFFAALSMPRPVRNNFSARWRNGISPWRRRRRPSRPGPSVIMGRPFGVLVHGRGKEHFRPLVEDRRPLSLGGRRQTGSNPINPETALLRGKQADYWFTIA
jgi:iron complex transport system substrate-binding protein